ncbi:hypothetical protein PanWU01x14_132560 [Parasponia andersonii]|uniref:Protein SENSITIVE TO UV 2 n=1 Tax=Parasponia andersonii TaxID=3476 RepID=A0A2P5CQQ8_PARAD|nr:hypothetical protein PanWU01x14_132560 [Parasponia andersonii]
MSEEGFEEWDAEFLDQLIQSFFPPQQCREPPPPPPLRNPTSYSPPRQLSQRTSALDSFPRSSNGAASTAAKCTTSSLSSAPILSRSELDKELEIERLKRELGRVSKQLSDLEQECSELRKKRDKKDGQPINVSSKNEEKDAALFRSKSTDSDRERGALGVDDPGVSPRFQNVISSSKRDVSQIEIVTSSCKAAGVQTDDSGVFAQVFSNDLLTSRDLSKKLLAIWGLPNKQMLGRNLVSNLLVACQTDLHVLFGYMGMNFSVKSRMDSPVYESSNMDLQYHVNSQPLEAAKLSHLYSVLTKINNGMAHLEALLEPLLDLCTLENIGIVDRSLRILHMCLKHLLSFERKFGESARLFLHVHVLMNFDLIFQCNLLRDNVLVDGLCFGNNIFNLGRSGTAEKTDIISVIRDETSYFYAGNVPLGTKLSGAKTIFEEGELSRGPGISVSRVDWISLFNLMLQIATRNTEESARLEAVSIMNVILIRCNSYAERERFGNTQVFESILQLLRKEAGLHVQKHSLRLLYLLLNCPKLLVTFCTNCTVGKDCGFTNATSEDMSAFSRSTYTLQGLADCVACSGNGPEVLKLRRNAIVLLAFLASSGKSGFDILITHKVSGDTNFLMLILQLLVSEIEVEASTSPESSDIFRERTLLMREALILLNRLVSNPVCSTTALQLLTKNRDMASLTIDIANRLSRKDQSSSRFAGLARIMRESEIVDLARVFKKRVFSYMGDHMV